MKIRELKRKVKNDFRETVVSAWPLEWGSSYAGAQKFPAGEEGTLESVTRTDDGLSLTISYAGRVYGPETLAWTPPPTLDAVEKVLRANIGKPIKTISELDV